MTTDGSDDGGVGSWVADLVFAVSYLIIVAIVFMTWPGLPSDHTAGVRADRASLSLVAEPK